MKMRAILAAGLFLAGCNPALSALEKQRAAIEARTRSIEAIGTRIRSSPTFAIGHFDLRGAPPDFPPGGSTGPTATAIDWLDFADLTRSRGRLMPKNPIADVAAWGRKGSLSDGSRPKTDLLPLFQEDVNKFLRLKYVLVLRSREEENPEAPKVIARFKGGAWSGDALLFEIDGPRYVGGIAFEGRNDKALRVREDAVDAELFENLRKNVIRDLQTSFKARFPGMQPPCQ